MDMEAKGVKPQPSAEGHRPDSRATSLVLCGVRIGPRELFGLNRGYGGWGWEHECFSLV